MSSENPDQPTISVVIPSLNQGPFLRRCLQSIVDQSYPHTEILLIDGGSTDETSRIAHEFRDQISYWVSETDSGQSEALNKGFAAANGEILCWLNSDDYFLDGAFSAVIAAFEQEPEAKVVYGDWLEVDEDEALIIKRYALDFSVRQAQYRAFSALAQAMFWRREVHQRFGSFPADVHQTMDIYMILSFVLTEGPDRFARLDKQLVSFRRHAAQKTGHLDADYVRTELAWIDQALRLRPRPGFSGKIERLALTMTRAYQYWRRAGFRYFIRFARFAGSDR